MYPPLLEIEKRWYCFLMLQAVHFLHSRGTYHSNIRLSNCLLTTWGWLYLSDAIHFRDFDIIVVCFYVIALI